MNEFYSKTAVITGAASGIGRALALRLAAKGAHLALADLNMEGLEETAAMIGPCDQKVTLRRLDVADRDGVHEFAQETFKQHSGVDLLFNNAGISCMAPVELLDYDYFNRIMDINFWGVVHGCKAFLPGMKNRPKAHIVNVSSVDAFTGPPNRSAYASAKAAIAAFSDSLESELEGSSVSVSCVFPGLIKTNIARSSLEYGRSFVTRHLQEVSGLGEMVIEELLKRAKTAVEIFEAADGTSPEDAAEIILDGVLQGKRRILVGSGAERLDQLVRNDPEGCLKTLNSYRKAMSEANGYST